MLAAQQQQLDDRRLRELRRCREAAVAAVVGLGEPRDGELERALVQRLRGWREAPAAGELLAHLRAAGADLLGVLAPGLGDREQHLAPRRHSVTWLGREVGAAVEGDLLGREEHVERPSAVAGHALHGLHVERVDVGALLAVDLDAHEALVHQRRSAGVLEGLVLHDVAPVAGRVADRHEQRHVALSCALRRPRGPTAASRQGSRRAGAGRARSLSRARSSTRACEGRWGQRSDAARAIRAPRRRARHVRRPLWRSAAWRNAARRVCLRRARRRRCGSVRRRRPGR